MLQTEAFTTQLSTRGRLIKFTPERVQQIRNLVERGKSKDEIAELIGVTIDSLQVTCSRLGVNLRRPVFNTQPGLLRSAGLHFNGPPDRDGGLSIPTKEQSGPGEQTQSTTSGQGRSHKV